LTIGTRARILETNDEMVIEITENNL